MTSEKLEARLRATIDAMLTDDETISTRSIMKRMPEDFRYPTAVSRPPALREIYLAGQLEQKRIRQVAAKNKQSRETLLRQIGHLKDTIQRQEGQICLLVASHCAMISAVGEFGAMPAYLEFFRKHSKALRELEALEALPERQNVIPLERDADD